MSRGGKRPGAGRPKGVANKATLEIREHYQNLINNNLEQIQEDLDKLKPKERMDVLIQLSKFVVPVMKAVEMSGSVKSPKIDMSKWK